eukprot:Nk52_evm6s351 gene=Nk52_evmTU6s351
MSTSGGESTRAGKEKEEEEGGGAEEVQAESRMGTREQLAQMHRDKDEYIRRERLKLAEKIKAERKADRERRALILKQIEEDRLVQQQQKEKQAREGSSSGNTNNNNSKNPTRLKDGDQSKEALIQLRLPNGQSKRGRFRSEERLSALVRFARGFIHPSTTDGGVEEEAQPEFILIQPFPHVEFRCVEDYEKTLSQLGLIPTGNLVVKMGAGPVAAGGAEASAVMDVTMMEDEEGQMRMEGAAAAASVRDIAPNPSEEERGEEATVVSSDGVARNARLRTFSRGQAVIDDRMAFVSPMEGVEGGRGGAASAPIVHSAEAVASAAFTRLNQNNAASVSSSVADLQRVGVGSRHRAEVKSLLSLCISASRTLLEHYGKNYGANAAESRQNVCADMIQRPALHKLSEELLCILMESLISQKTLNLKLFSAFAEHSGKHLGKVNLQGYANVSNDYLQCLSHLSTLRSLNLNSCPLITDQGFRHLKHLHMIEEVNVGGCRVTDATLEVLAEFSKLQILIVDFTSVGDAGIGLLSAKLPNLRNLSLNHCKNVSNDALLKICESKHMCDTLTALHFSHTAISNVSPLKNVSQLMELSMSFTSFGDEAFALLGQHCQTLEVLKIGSDSACNFSDSGFAQLVQLQNLKQIELPNRLSISNSIVSHVGKLSSLIKLDLSDCVYVTDEGIMHISSLANLTVLLLANTKVSDVGLAALLPLTRLQELVLDRTSITNDGLKHIRPLQYLKHLSLAHTLIGDDCLALPRNSEETRSSINHLLCLESLNLSSTSVTDLGVCALELPELEVLNLDRTFCSTNCRESLFLSLPKLRHVRLNALRQTSR